MDNQMIVESGSCMVFWQRRVHVTVWPPHPHHYNITSIIKLKLHLLHHLQFCTVLCCDGPQRAEISWGGC